MSWTILKSIATVQNIDEIKGWGPHKSNALDTWKDSRKDILEQTW